MGGRGWARWSGVKGGKWDNCNSIINKCIFKKRLLYPAKIAFRMEGQIKCFSDKVKLKEFIITKPLLYEMSKRLTQEIEEDQTL